MAKDVTASGLEDYRSNPQDARHARREFVITMATKQIGLSSDLLIHPGETLREAIDGRGMNQKELALRTAFAGKHISKVLNGKAPISPKFAMALETALGISSVFWLNLQTNYDIELMSLKQPEKPLSIYAAALPGGFFIA
jgi:addiction module HigA family antidote